MLRRFPAGLTRAKVITDDLQCHLDAGDINSYPNTAGYQFWLDLTANSYDFMRGDTTGATSRDPTHNGTPGGLSADEFWSFDGGDEFFQLNNDSGSILRKIGRQDTPFTIEIWARFANTTTNFLAFCNAFAAGEDGFYWQVNNVAARLQPRPMPLNVLGTASTVNFSAGVTTQFAISGRCNGSTGIHVRNGVQEGTWAQNNSGWTTGDSTRKVSLFGRQADAALMAPSGSRLYVVRIYDVALTADQLAQNFSAQRSRFGI